MRKIALIIIGSLVFLFFSVVFSNADDLDKSLKDFEREMRLQKQQQSLGKLGQDIKKFKIEEQTAKDRAVLKNEERLKEFMESQNKNLTKDFGDWGFKIPGEQRLIVDLFAVALFISFLSFIFYRQRHRRLEKEKEAKR